MTSQELFTEIIKDKEWYKNAKLKRSTAYVYKSLFLNGKLNEEIVNKILKEIEEPDVLNFKTDNLTSEELFAKIVQKKGWYKNTKLKYDTIKNYKYLFLNGKLSKRIINKILKQLGYIFENEEDVPDISNLKTENLTSRELFAEIIKDKEWYKNTKLGKNTARAYKYDFFKGKLSERRINKLLKQMGYEVTEEMSVKEVKINPEVFNIKTENLTSRELFAEIIKVKGWYRSIGINCKTAGYYKYKFLRRKLSDKVISKTIKKLGYGNMLNVRTENIAPRELFAEIIKNKEWYKGTSISRQRASDFKYLFLKGKLSLVVLNRIIEQWKHRDVESADLNSASAV